MNQPQLNPREGAGIPRREQISAQDKKLMEEVAELTKNEAAAFAVLAQAQAATAETSEESALLLRDIKDCLVKVMVHFSIPLPASIKAAMDADEYSPDDMDEGEDDEDNAEEKGPDVEVH